MEPVTIVAGPGSEKSKRINWNLLELLLACELLASNAYAPLDKRDARALALSEMLRSARFHPKDQKPDNFRSPSSVARKTRNIADSMDSESNLASNGSKLDKVAIDLWTRDPSVSKMLLDNIRELMKSGE